MSSSIERCIDCRRIKDASGRWSYSVGTIDVESLPRESICPPCSAKRFPDFHADSNGELELDKKASPSMHSKKRMLDLLKAHFSGQS